MYLSYWEYKTWFKNVDFTVVGSGIVGLNCALKLREKFPKSKIIVLEKGFLPAGASTKNAGFACFGSMSEILEDLKNHSEEEVLSLIKKRYEGLQQLRNLLGDMSIGYKNFGGHEIFLKENPSLYHEVFQALDRVNRMLLPFFKKQVFDIKKDTFGFKGIYPEVVFNSFESQIDTGKMMQALLQKAIKKNIVVLNGITVKSFQESSGQVQIQIQDDIVFSTKSLYIAINGFSSTLVNEDIKPARAQVLITKPIKNLKIKGTFHFDSGYYYFRNIDNRILFGGGRNLDFKAEETAEINLTSLVQNKLEDILKSTILPETPFVIDQRWSGIMGVGKNKTPILKALSDRVFCGIRLSGMGVAIGTQVGRSLGDFE